MVLTDRDGRLGSLSSSGWPDERRHCVYDAAWLDGTFSGGGDGALVRVGEAHLHPVEAAQPLLEDFLRIRQRRLRPHQAGQGQFAAAIRQRGLRLRRLQAKARHEREQRDDDLEHPHLPEEQG
ncbi:MAG: hypothetical protein JF617_21075 [Burkholderiales bacterium]|nr:hypothetical protein [Burkholderiales bacterium]